MVAAGWSGTATAPQLRSWRTRERDEAVQDSDARRHKTNRSSKGSDAEKLTPSLSQEVRRCTPGLDLEAAP